MQYSKSKSNPQYLKKVMLMDGGGTSEAETCSEQGENLLPSSLSNLNYWL